MEYTPPPFFKQGPSARARLLFFALLAIGLLVMDARHGTLGMVRHAAAVLLYPVQRVAMFPVELASSVGQHFSSLAAVQQELDGLRRERTALAARAMQAGQLETENAHLRQILEMHRRPEWRSVAAQIMYEGRDWFSQRVVINRGSAAGLVGGEPVVDMAGIVGQVTRVFPLNAEVTLVTDKDHVIPVLDLRSGVRAIAYGSASVRGLLELRFVAENLDVRTDDLLVTSGVDGVYPAGFPVARVTTVEAAGGQGFSRILAEPLGGVHRQRHVLVLMFETAAADAAPPELALPRGKAAGGR